MLSGFELYPRWVPLFLARLERLPERQSELQKTFLEFELGAIK